MENENMSIEEDMKKYLQGIIFDKRVERTPREVSLLSDSGVPQYREKAVINTISELKKQFPRLVVNVLPHNRTYDRFIKEFANYDRIPEVLRLLFGTRKGDSSATHDIFLTSERIVTNYADTYSRGTDYSSLVYLGSMREEWDKLEIRQYVATKIGLRLLHLPPHVTEISNIVQDDIQEWACMNNRNNLNDKFCHVCEESIKAFNTKYAQRGKI